jgi:hypothetical protein
LCKYFSVWWIWHSQQSRYIFTLQKFVHANIEDVILEFPVLDLNIPFLFFFFLFCCFCFVVFISFVFILCFLFVLFCLFVADALKCEGGNAVAVLAQQNIMMESTKIIERKGDCVPGIYSTKYNCFYYSLLLPY